MSVACNFGGTIKKLPPRLMKSLKKLIALKPMESQNSSADSEPNENRKDSISCVSISEHCPSWRKQFLEEAKAIRSSVKSTSIYIDHVGSTAIKGLPSKPIVDILLSLSNWTAAEALVHELNNLGYRMNERCDDTPRYFLTKYSIDGSGSFNIHICHPHSRWARDMLIFRDELAENSEFAKAYATLKKQLAKTFREDVASYMSGKKDFIERKLLEIESEYSVNKLLTHQSAESNRAEYLQIAMIISQLLVALTATISIYSNDNKYLFVAAILGFSLLVLWLFFHQGQQRHRSAGDQARRAILLISGLDMEPSAGQKLRISDGFSAPVSQGTIRREEDHFASREAPGYKRLAEMIEESSYWTRDLQRTSARVMAILLTVLATAVCLTGGAAIASLSSDNLISLSRALIAIMVFVISSDSVGLLLAYRNSAIAIDDILKRVESATAKGNQKPDILLLMTDYNAVIEKAPATLPWVYKLRHRRLSRRWQSYIDAKLGRSNSSATKG